MTRVASFPCADCRRGGLGEQYRICGIPSLTVLPYISGMATKAEKLLTSGLREVISDLEFLRCAEKDTTLVSVIESSLLVANIYLRTALENE